MRPLTAVNLIILGSCFAITFSLGAVLIVVLVLGEEYPRLQAEFRRTTQKPACVPRYDRDFGSKFLRAHQISPSSLLGTGCYVARTVRDRVVLLAITTSRVVYLRMPGSPFRLRCIRD